MSIDESLRAAGRRLDAMPISTPEPDVVVASSVRHRRRQRMVYASACIVLVAALVTVGIVGWNGHAPVDDRATLAPPSTGAIGLGSDRLWPPQGRSYDSASALGEDFVAEVLGWSGAEVVEVARQGVGGNVAVELRANGPEGVRLRLLAQLVDGSWWLQEVGESDGSLGVKGDPDGVRTTELVASGNVAEGVSTRWWIVVDGEELAPRDAPAPVLPPGSSSTGGEHVFILDVPIDDLGAVLVVFMDESGVVVDANGGVF
jgi:hypothetical protein